jgi:hypothetical protein
MADPEEQLRPHPESEQGDPAPLEKDAPGASFAIVALTYPVILLVALLGIALGVWFLW